MSELNRDLNMGRDANTSHDSPVNPTSTQLNMSNMGRDTSMYTRIYLILLLSPPTLFNAPLQ